MNDLVITGLYRPPQAPLLYFKDRLTNIKCFIQQYNPENILMVGHFNFHYVNWSTHTLITGVSISVSDKAAFPIYR